MPNTKNYSTRLRVYQYEDPNFSIFSTELSEDDLLHLSQALDILQRFNGMPEADWVAELSARLNLCMSNHKEVRAAVGFESSMYNKGMEHFTPLFNAIRKKTTVELRYQSFRMADPQTLIVHPYYLKQYNNRWFLFCCNGDHTNLSNYPLDRILSVKLAHVPYRDTDIDFDEYFTDMIGVSRRYGQEPEDVVLRFPKDQYKYVSTKPWHGSQTVIEENDDFVTMQMHVIINYELEQKILSFGDYVEVVAPRSLRDRIKERMDKSLEKYK